GEYQFGIHSFAFLDPDGFSLLLGTGGVVNYVGVSDPALDTLLSDGRAALDESERIDIYRDVQQYVIDEVTHAFFLRQQGWEFYNDRVQNMGPDSQFSQNGGLQV